MIKGVRFHTLTNAYGDILKVKILPANEHDVIGAKLLSPSVRKRKAHVDLGYRGANTGLFHRVFHGKNDKHKIRWKIERTFSWMLRQRRLFNFFERFYQTVQEFIYLFNINNLLRRFSL